MTNGAASIMPLVRAEKEEQIGIKSVETRKDVETIKNKRLSRDSDWMPKGILGISIARLLRQGM